MLVNYRSSFLVLEASIKLIVFRVVRRGRFMSNFRLSINHLQISRYISSTGNGYRTKKRFAKFNNVPELMQMFKEFADIRTPDMLNLPVPELEGGKPQTIVAHPNDEQ